MKSTKTLYWSPRILMMIIIAFFILFSLDVFTQNSTALEIIISFFIHNIPTILLIIITYFAHKNEFIGGITLILAALALFSITNFALAAFTILQLPIIIAGLLFILNNQIKENNKQK